MQYRQASPRLSILLMGFVFAAVYLAEHSIAVPQDGSGSVQAKDADSFRKEVVTEWGWKPNHGVALTTTEFARNYLTRSKFTWQQQPLSSILSSSKLVLFQTDTLDIFVSRSPMPLVAVVRRGTGEILAECLNRNIIIGCNAGFVDVDGALPFELKFRKSVQPGTGSTRNVFDIYDLSGGLTPMMELRGQYSESNCPAMQTVPARAKQREQDWYRDTGTVRLTFKNFLMLRSHNPPGCQPVRSEVYVRKTCRLDHEKRKYVCKSELVRQASITLPMLKTGHWENNAQNIRWMLKNSGELRENGFRFPKGFLGKLPSHLPEGSQVR